jgi:hypothetical protein
LRQARTRRSRAMRRTSILVPRRGRSKLFA